MKHVFEREQVLGRPRCEVFAFFADASNLERLTPTSLHFKILTALPLNMGAGAVIDYQLRLFGIGFRWRTLIEHFEPESRFVDVQLRGPYRTWRHLHEFVEVAAGTLMRDRVEYELPFGPAGEMARVLFVGRQLRHIFDYRRAIAANIFAANRDLSPDLSGRSSVISSR